jgi:hypothetical protein
MLACVVTLPWKQKRINMMSPATWHHAKSKEANIINWLGKNICKVLLGSDVFYLDIS